MDCLCGKDKTFAKHPVNALYRSMVEARSVEYAAAHSKHVKMQLTNVLVEELRQQWGTRFLQQQPPSSSSPHHIKNNAVRLVIAVVVG